MQLDRPAPVVHQVTLRGLPGSYERTWHFRNPNPFGSRGPGRLLEAVALTGDIGDAFHTGGQLQAAHLSRHTAVTAIFGLGEWF